MEEYVKLRAFYDPLLASFLFFCFLVPLVLLCVCVCACVCVCVCVCVRQSTVKASSLWIREDTMEQINDVMLKTSISYAKSLQRYCRVQYLTFLTSRLVYARMPYFPTSRTNRICIGLF